MRNEGNFIVAEAGANVGSLQRSIYTFENHLAETRMRISVVTAVLNRQATIAQSIKSVQYQDYAELEHIIQDGASRDGTLNTIRCLANATTHVVSEPDTGIYDALNRGIARATGDIIGVMHSDDFFASPQILTQIFDAFKDPRVDGVYGDLNYVASHDTTKVVRYWKSGPYHQDNLARGWMPPHPTLYLRRHVFERWGTYDTRLRIAADYDAILRYLTMGQIQLTYIPKVLVCMRTGGESNKSVSRIFRKSQEDYRAIQRHGIGGFGTLAQKNMRKAKQFLQIEKFNK